MIGWACVAVDGAMNALVRAVVVVAVASLLAACVSPTPYQPAPPRGFGYSEERLDQNKFRVSFRGNSLTKRETVEDYLLFSHFLIIGRDTEAKTRYRYWIDSYGGRGWFYHGFPGWHRRPWYDPWGPWGGYDVQPVTTYTATAEIILVKSAVQDGEAWAFDAQQVLVQVGPRVVRPEQVPR
jgi:hypothetical protein